MVASIGQAKRGLRNAAESSDAVDADSWSVETRRDVEAVLHFETPSGAAAVATVSLVARDYRVTAEVVEEDDVSTPDVGPRRVTDSLELEATVGEVLARLVGEKE